MPAQSWKLTDHAASVFVDSLDLKPIEAGKFAVKKRTLRGGLYGLAIFVGILVLPRLAAFGYFLVAALSVLSARGEGRLTVRGPPG